MKKKLALTGILLQKNDYFILDEPFNGLDMEGYVVLTEILLKLRELGKTVIVSSHIFTVLSQICDTIYYLKKGHSPQTVTQAEYQHLEQTLKDVTVGNRLSQIGLE